MKLSNSGNDPKEDIVISGISGRFAEADNMQELRDNLMNNIDMVTADDRRWPKGFLGLPQRLGKHKDISKFDANFFGITNEEQIYKMDPQLRFLMESTYEAIADAGINPQDLRGLNVGVFIGVSITEYYEAICETLDQDDYYSLLGAHKGMYPNCISYHFDFKGPSLALDTACSSSLYALDVALQNLRSNLCDAAIVGSASLNLRPSTSLGFSKLGVTSPDGRCKSFDIEANGYARSEATATIFLQKLSDARRVYATVLNVKTNNDGYKEEGITFPKQATQLKLLQEIYNETNINPKDVVYIEAHGTGTSVGDPVEVGCIAEVLCKNRTEPLLMGSVKSSYGHSEPSSGLCSIAKVIIAMEEGIIPANLHFKTPNPKIPSIIDGRIKVVSENIPWRGGIVGINSFGFGGANAHLILRSNNQTKVYTPIPPNNAVRLFIQASRTEDNLLKILNHMENNRDLNLFTLLSNLAHSSVQSHPYRGYTLINSEKQRQEIKRSPVERPAVWYVMTGMGSHWKGMAKSMMQLKVFHDSMSRANDILKSYNINLLDMIMNEDEKSYKYITNAFATVVSIQVALINTLKILEIGPDGIVGHSVGELACGYADGSLTEEQVILAAYWRGRILSEESDVQEGLMASVGIPWESIQQKIPEAVYLACINATDNVTLSGLKSSITSLVEKFETEGIFNRILDTGGYAFHCELVSPVAPKMLTAFQKVIPKPKPRSQKWLSSSIPESQWNSSLAATASAEYYTNNFLKPVLFQNAISKVPKNAVVIEIGAHCLLQAIIKRNLGADIAYVGLQNKNEDGLTHFLAQIGKLYLNGLNPKIQNLWDPVTLPVPSGTQMISPLIGWDHSATYQVPSYKAFADNGSSRQTVEISIENEDSKDYYLTGHVIDGRNLFPATGYMLLAWKSYARLNGIEMNKMSVIFEDVIFHQATILTTTEKIKFAIDITKAGNFEINLGDSTVVTGRVYEPENATLQYKDDILPRNTESEGLKLTSKDFYKELRLRGYEYGTTFQGVIEANNEGTFGKLQWNGNWVTYLDTMLQFSIFGRDIRFLYLPTEIPYMKINSSLHPTMKNNNSTTTDVVFDPAINVILAGEVEIKGLKTSVVNRRPIQQVSPTLERYSFVPYFENKLSGIRDPHIIKACLDIVIENAHMSKLKFIEIGAATGHLFPQVMTTLNYQQRVQVECIVTDANIEDVNVEEANKYSVQIEKWDYVSAPASENISKAHLLFGNNVLKTENLSNVLENLSSGIRDKGFLLLLQTEIDKTLLYKNLNVSGFELVAEKEATDSSTLVLLKKIRKYESKTNVILIEENEYHKWVDPLKTKLNKLANKENSEDTLWLVGYGSTNGILGLVNCLRLESGGDKIRSIFDPSLESNKIQQFITNPVEALQENYSDVIKKDLVMNVRKDGIWGSYRHLLLDDGAFDEITEKSHACVDILNRGDLSSLRWVETTFDANVDVCRIYYAALNFRDIMLATGKLSPDAIPNVQLNKSLIGMEFSGLDPNGRRIMGVVPNSGLATHVVYEKKLLWDVPDHWTLEEAATVPVVYATVYYALVIRGELRRGQSILIHSGSGGVGQAAIHVALSYECEIYVTVGSQEKKSILLNIFHQLKANNIFNSRDISFEKNIMIATAGKGVDIVLNSLAEDKLAASIRCLGNEGRFLEIGKVDMFNNNSIGMSMFLKNASFHGILFDAILTEASCSDQKLCQDLIKRGIETGVVKPLIRRIFAKEEIEAAFRFMANGKHVGKVIIKVADEELKNENHSVSVNAIQGSKCVSWKSYVIAGGLGGFGLEVAHWLVAKGAKNLIMSSRFGVRDGYQSRCVRVWRKQGVNVVISTSDITTSEGATNLLIEANRFGPVGGIFNLAMVLRDALMENQSVDNYEIVCNPKISGTKQLDAASRKMCPQLEWFVVFSSVSCGKGNPGQSNYGYANSVMERICEERRKDGLPGMAIQWGIVGDVGVVMETMRGNDEVIGGTIPQDIRSCLKTLDCFLSRNDVIVSSTCNAEKEASSSSVKNKNNLLDTILRILGISDVATVNGNMTLAELGMDSIMATEIKQVFEKKSDTSFSTAKIRKLTINYLASIII